MPSGPTTSQSLGDSLQYIQDEARMEREYGTVVTRLVDKRTLPMNTGRKWDEVKISKISAQSVDETTDLENFQQFVDTLFSVEPSMIGVSTFITDKARHIVSTDSLAETGKGMQQAIERLKDTTGLVVLDSFASLGGAGSTLTNGIISAAKTENAYGGGSEPWTGRQVGILQSRQVKDLRDELVSGVGTYPIPQGLTAEVYRQGYEGSVDGVELWVDDNLTIDSSDDAKGGVFAAGKGGAIVYVQGTEAKTKEDYLPAKGGGGLAIYQYDDFGYGIRLSNWGREIYSDAAAVTS